MNSKEFAAQYKDSRWQKKRLQIMERDAFTCHMCKKGDGEEICLNVHHAYYVKGMKPWEYHDHLLVTLCEDCHKSLHEAKDLISDAMAHMTLAEIKGMINLIYANGVPCTLEALAKINLVPDIPLMDAMKAVSQAFLDGKECS